MWQFAGGRAAKQAATAATAIQNMEIVRLTATGSSREATISGDGRYVAYIDGRRGAVRRCGSRRWRPGSRVQIVPPEDVSIWDPVFSPDGDFIYYCRMKEARDPYPSLYRVATLGGRTQKVMDQVSGRVSFSPDGRRFVFYRAGPEENSLVVSNVDGTDPQVITTKPNPVNYDDPVWSPDGKIIAASLQTWEKGPATHLVGIPPEGGAEHRLTDEEWFGIGEIAWMPDGSGLIINGQSLEGTQLWEILYPSGDARRVTNDLNSYHGVGITADGKTLVAQLVESVYYIFVHDLDEAEPRRITKNVSGNEGDGIAWAPDGSLIYDTVSGGLLEIWTVNTDGSDARRLIAGDALNAGPSVTVDGKYIVHMSTNAETVNIWRADLDGSNPMQLTHGSLDIEPHVSPDGSWVLYLDTVTQQLRRVPIEGGDSIVVREKRGGTGEISPDGKLILTASYYEDEQRLRSDRDPRGRLRADGDLDRGALARHRVSGSRGARCCRRRDTGALRLRGRPDSRATACSLGRPAVRFDRRREGGGPADPRGAGRDDRADALCGA